MTYKLNPFTGKLDTSDGPQGPAGVVSAAGPGSQATPSISFAADLDTGLYNYTANGIAVSTGGTGRLFISDDGKVGIGVSDPSSYNISADDLVIADPNGFNSGISINITDNTGSSNIWFGDSDGEGRGRIVYGHAFTDSMDFWVGGNQNLSLYQTGGLAHIGGGSAITPAVSFNGSAPSNSLVIDSDGRLLVGTSTARSGFGAIQVEGTSYNSISCVNNTNDTGSSSLVFGKSRGTATGSNTIVQSGDILGSVIFQGADGTDIATRAAAIFGMVDGTPGSNNMPGRLVFSTTADGASSPTARMTIKNDGNVGIGTQSPALKLHAEDSSQQIVRWARTGVGAGSLDVDASGNAVLNAHTTSTGIAFHLQASEKARIDSSGRLLVGTGSDVSGGIAGEICQAMSSAGAVLDLGRNTSSATTDDQMGGISFYSFAGSSWQKSASILCQADAAQGDDDKPGRLVFSTTANGASSPTPRATIDSSGRLLVGTSSDTSAAKFIVQGLSSDSTVQGLIDIRRGTRPTVADTEIGSIRFKSGAADTRYAQISCFSDGASSSDLDIPGRLVFSTTADGASAATERMRIDSSGNVGIGTTSPNGKLSLAKGGTNQFRALDVANNTAEYSIYLDQDNNGSNSFSLFDTTNSQTALRYFPGATGYWQVYTNNQERLRITSTGTLMHIGAGNSTTPAVQFNASAPADSLVIDGSGRLLVGTDSTSAVCTALLQNRSDDGGPGTLYLSTTTTSPTSVEAFGRIAWTDSGHSPAVQIQGGRDGGTWTSGTSQPSRLAFFTTRDGGASPTERMRITSDAYVRLASGTGGIQFNGDTAAANALDDYEEGTFTPNISYNTSNGDRVVVTQIGRYTKVGRIVHVNIAISWTESTASGDVSITGLPFTSVNISSNVAVGAASCSSGLTGISGGLFGIISPNSTTVPLFYGSTGVRVRLNETNTIGFGGQFVQLSISYEAA